MKFDAKAISYVIAAIGLAVSLYLVTVQYAGTTLVCPNTGIINCENVLTSQYSKLFGIPNSVFGTVFFITDLIVIWKYFGKDEPVILNAIGLAFVLYYMYAEYLIGNICVYCTTTHIAVILLLIISIKYHRPGATF